MLCAGIVAAAIYNSNPWRESGANPVRPQDFLPEEPPNMSEEEIEEAAVAFFERLAGQSAAEHARKAAN